jgi:hypothetical protein
LKAIDIINFINEDKFSKYTIKQIYDELGEEDFLNYISDICYQTVKNHNLEHLVGMKINKTLTAHVNNGTNVGFCFYKKQKHGVETVYIYLNLNEMRIRIASRIDGDIKGDSRGKIHPSVEIASDRIRISNKIRDGIIETYNYLSGTRNYKR